MVVNQVKVRRRAAMLTRAKLALLSLVVLSLPGSAAACLWDYDTLREERQRFPDALELITGKFLRHSVEFYRWRIEDRKKKLSAQPDNLDYLDDLAVAYEKTGDHAKAIETMMTAEKIKPYRYETKANLATFYVHAGDLPKCLQFVREALAINPDAHFGRERYQMWLVEYILESQVNGKTVVPLRTANAASGANDETKRRSRNFGEFVGKRMGHGGLLAGSELQKAVTGVLGMMRFANFENPILLEALGDLLLTGRDPTVDAKRLAARCYLKASYVTDDPVTKTSYRQLAECAIEFQTQGPYNRIQLPLPELEHDFQEELADAKTWYEDVKAHELGWIHDGKDADAEYDRRYRYEPAAADVRPFIIDEPALPFVVLGGGIVILIAAVWFIRRYNLPVRRPPPRRGPGE
jgi:tetratricopeptide (TPR) repeat protein